MNKENCALKLVDEIILYYDARSKKHHIPYSLSNALLHTNICISFCFCVQNRSIFVSLTHAVAQLVEALGYKAEGRGFVSDRCIGIFH